MVMRYVNGKATPTVADGRDDHMNQDSAKTATLRSKIDVHRPAVAMAAHNPLAAKLAAGAGFDAIWGSGFELSASYAVPDANILSVDIHLEMMRAIGEVQDAPVVADIDTGFGNAVNVAYVIPRYAAAGVAAVVMEDKTFPKDSSLRAGGRQELVPIAEFQGKLAAAKAAGGVLVIARTEALIAGLGQKEALRRGEAYAEAGADGVLIHSKQKTPDEILAFCRAWPGRVPLVLVPTSYPQLSFADVAALGKVGLIICGNHAIRAAVAAMQSTFRRILAEGGIAGVESDIASVAEVFALQGDEHMRKLEKAYLR
jgi:phosphonopyruvate hydrolase